MSESASAKPGNRRSDPGGERAQHVLCLAREGGDELGGRQPATQRRALAEEEGYLAARAEMPLDRAAAQALHSAGPAGIDVIGLGSGDGKEEVRLTRHLALLRESDVALKTEQAQMGAFRARQKGDGLKR